MLAVLDGRGRGRALPQGRRAAGVRPRPLRDAAARRPAAPLRRGPRAPEAGRARRRVHVDARLGGGQALGARLRPVAAGVPRDLVRQLRAQRAHRGAGRLAGQAPRPAARAGGGLAAARPRAARLPRRDERPAQGVPLAGGRGERRDRDARRVRRPRRCSGGWRRATSMCCTSWAMATSTRPSAKASWCWRTSTPVRARSAPRRYGRWCASAG